MKFKRINWFYWLLIAAFSGIGGRLVNLQGLEFKYYRALADENRVKLEIIRATRGVFYDRFGEILVRNLPTARDYIYGETMSHVLGYVGEISQEELEACQEQIKCQRQMGDLVGKMGLEKEYDLKLRGIDGGILKEHDSQGLVVREIARKEAMAGENLKLTLDAGLQRKAYELLAGRKGAIIASEPGSGEILAIVSGPGFKPDQVAKYLDSQDFPLFDRAISGEYPPGSVFKVITGIAALEEGKADETTLIEDTGEIRVGPYRFGNWYFDQYGRKEGKLDIIRAYARSNDIFFYKLGEALGMSMLADWGKYFGLGEVTKIDLPGEARGLMPDPDWKKRQINEAWYLGDTYISAIGQGNILMTPIQVNQMMSVVASGGQWCRPHLIKSEIRSTKSEICRKMDIHEKTLALVKEGLKQVTETGGTAFPFFEFKVKGERIYVGGKTGTAEFGPDVTSGQAEKRTHAWITVMAPVDKPQIVATVLLEAAGEGSYQAAPVAKDLLTYWFERR